MDTGRSGSPNPGGKFSLKYSQEVQSSSPNGSLGKGVIQKQTLIGPTSNKTIQKQDRMSPVVGGSSGLSQQSQRKGQSSGKVTPADLRARFYQLTAQNQSTLQRRSSGFNQTGSVVKGITQTRTKPITTTSGSSESPRKPQRGKQKAASVAQSQQPASTSAYEVQSLEATLTRAPPDEAKERTPQSRQKKREKVAAASATSTGVALESRHDDVDESRVSEPPQTISPAGDLPLPIKPTRSMVWIDFGLIGEHLFGSLISMPGVRVKVTVPPMRMGDPVIVLSMKVNKNDISKPTSRVESEVSRFELVLTLRVLTRNKPRKQHNFKYACLQNNEASLGEARAEVMKITKGNLEHVLCIDTGVTSYRISSPYEPQYWNPLRDSDLLAHRAIGASGDCLNLLEQIGVSKIHFKFWFRLPCVSLGVPEPTLGKSPSPSEPVSDDRLTVTPRSGFAASPGRFRSSSLSMEEQFEHRIIVLRRRAIYHESYHQSRTRDLEREVDALKAEAIASVAQQRREAVISEQKDEQLSELQAQNGRLKKRLEFEREALMGQLVRYNQFVRSIRRTSRHLPGISVEDEASQSSDDWPVAISDPPVDKAGESRHGRPAVTPDRMVGESDQEPAPPSDQGLDIEPLNEAEGVPFEMYAPDDEASDTAHDSDTAIGINTSSEPPTSSPADMAVGDHEQFNTDWAAECHNLKKMKRSAKSKRKQQKKLTEKD